MKCVLCQKVFEVRAAEGRRNPNRQVRCPQCGKIQIEEKLTGPQVRSQAVVPSTGAVAPRRFLLAKARAKCDSCRASFEHELGDHDPLVCPKCMGTRITRVMGRIFVVPDGATEEALHPRLRKWLRLLRKQNEWVVTFERHIGAIETDLVRIGFLDGEVKEWAELLGRLKKRVERARDERLAEFERYVSMSGR